MPNLSNPCAQGFELIVANPVKSLKKTLAGFFKSKEITRIARIYHGRFTYDLVPDTAICNFYNMNKVTSVDAGDLFIYVFEEEQYQGTYQIIKPGEKAEIGLCGSMVISMHPAAIDAFRNNKGAPEGYWEMSGSRYLFHFSSNYRYA